MVLVLRLALTGKKHRHRALFRCRHPSWMTSMDMKCRLQTGPLNYQILMFYKMKPHFSWSFTVCKVVETYSGLQHTAEIIIIIIMDYPTSGILLLVTKTFSENNNDKQILRTVVAAKKITINCKHLQESYILPTPPFLLPGSYCFLVWSHAWTCI